MLYGMGVVEEDYNSQAEIPAIGVGSVVDRAWWGGAPLVTVEDGSSRAAALA